MPGDFPPPTTLASQEPAHPNEPTPVSITELKDTAQPHTDDHDDPNQAPADHSPIDTRLEGYAQKPRHNSDPIHRKHFQLPEPSRSSTNRQPPYHRTRPHPTPKLTRATALQPYGKPSDEQKEVPACPIGQHYMDIDLTGLDSRERTSAILYELRRNPLDPLTRGIPSHNKLIPDGYIPIPILNTPALHSSRRSYPTTLPTTTQAAFIKT